jgi:hypothetical protein
VVVQTWYECVLGLQHACAVARYPPITSSTHDCDKLVTTAEEAPGGLGVGTASHLQLLKAVVVVQTWCACVLRLQHACAVARYPPVTFSTRDCDKLVTTAVEATGGLGVVTASHLQLSSAVVVVQTWCACVLGLQHACAVALHPPVTSFAHDCDKLVTTAVEATGGLCVGLTSDLQLSTAVVVV